VSGSLPASAEDRASGGAAVRITLAAGRPPLGAIFGGIGLAAAAVVGLLGLDRLPITVCMFKGLTGLPCPTCGSTRAAARLFDLDLPGAMAMNPLAALVAVVIAAWAVADLALLPSRRSLRIELSPRLRYLLRAAILIAFFANWVYLLAAGR